MSDNPKGHERNKEIVMFFYYIFGNRIHNGMNPDAARKDAYDAVTLRYGIGKGRLLNIISAQRCSQDANMVAFRESVETLIENLTVMNIGLDATKERNERLITLLEECLNDDKGA